MKHAAILFRPGLHLGLPREERNKQGHLIWATETKMTARTSVQCTHENVYELNYPRHQIPQTLPPSPGEEQDRNVLALRTCDFIRSRDQATLRVFTRPTSAF
jgi:hypothetical protein